MGFTNLDWICVGQDRHHWLAFVKFPDQLSILSAFKEAPCSEELVLTI